MSDKISTDSYKGVRDFYPEDMAVQQYIFDTWSKTAESFGFCRYDASILEPSELYKAKGAENAEMVNEQTYTFTDRGEREVTLRPEMTPTVARMVAKKARELAFPLRWYSIPNLFRYERTQRGRLREHWQLNCDIFGSTELAADVEMITLAYQTLVDFGATPDMFEILINNRATMQHAYAALGIEDSEKVTAITRLNDRKDKIAAEEYLSALTEITNDEALSTEIKNMIEQTDGGDNAVIAALDELGITNTKLDRSLARGFDYYTGTIFEIKDTDPENNRSMLGGGRYDNLTEMFGGEIVPGIGFGMGDVTMRDFLESHNLLEGKMKRSTTEVVIIPTSPEYNIVALKIAKNLRSADISIHTDFADRTTEKKTISAKKYGIDFLITIGEKEVLENKFNLLRLNTGNIVNDTVEELHKILRSEQK